MSSEGRIALVVARLLIGAAAIAPVWFWSGGVLEEEATVFIQQYLDDRGLFRTVLDPSTNDFGTYQARELSYFFDFLDAQVFRGLMAMDVVAFIPATAVAASLLIIGIFHAGTMRLQGLPALTSALLLLLFLSNFVYLVTMGMYYRSTKPLLAPVLMATVFHLAGWFDGRRDRTRTAMLVFVAFGLMSLLDRQGYVYAITGASLLAGHAVISRGGWSVAAAGAAAVVVATVYDFWIGPALVWVANGYAPDRWYQHVPVGSLYGFTPYAQAAELLGAGLTTLLGGLPAWLAAGAMFALAAASVARARNRARTALVLIVIAGSQVLMFAGMVVRHSPVYEWIDHRYWYYPLPFQAMVVALAAVLLDRVLAGGAPSRARVVNMALAAAIAANVAWWPSYRDRMLTSHWFSVVYPQTALLKTSLATGRPDPGLEENYRNFYDFCLTLSPGMRGRAAGAISGTVHEELPREW